ncbi:hypothetical protein [Klebsiella phage 05F01]|nr:hypothetical protein [Klebsiella phage 05F01]
MTPHLLSMKIILRVIEEKSKLFMPEFHRNNLSIIV